MTATAISIISSDNCPWGQKVGENISQINSPYVSLDRVLSHDYPQKHVVFDLALLQVEVDKGKRGVIIG